MKKRKQDQRFAAIFDFDGTLVESHPRRNVAHSKVCEVLLKHLNSKGSIIREVLSNLISQMEIEMNQKKIYNRDIYWKSKNDVGNQHIKHALLIADLLIALKRSCRTMKGIELVEYSELFSSFPETTQNAHRLFRMAQD